MATTQQRVHQTGFTVGATTVRFGLLWGDLSALFGDWQRESRYVDLEGPDLTVTQLLGRKPRRVSYRLFFETAAEFRALDALVQQTGTLTLYHAGHSVAVAASDTVAVHGTLYDRVGSVTLLSLLSAGIAPDGTVEAESVWQVSS